MTYTVICEATIIQADHQTSCHYYSHLKKTFKRAILSDLETRYTDSFAADLHDKARFCRSTLDAVFLTRGEQEEIITDIMRYRRS